jgi:S-adenosylmethionine:tRNA ribosyltransferase-isomerase
MLVYDRALKSVEFATFADLPKYLPPNAVVVLNQTKVVPARFEAKRKSGGKVELLYLSKVGKQEFTALADRQLKVGEELVFGLNYTLTVVDKLVKGFLFKASFPTSKLFSVLEEVGITPIPPYIKQSPLKERQLRTEYQTVFAKTAGSVAAPTASLHFTKSLLGNLKKRGVAIEYVTLHVGLGTFAPLTEAQLQSGRLHEEWYEIDAATASRLRRYKKEGRPIIAVGTTVVRTLESAASKSSKLARLSGTTDLFIYPPYKPRFVTGLITNFHVPKSSLLMLVASFIGREKLLKLYKTAIAKKFRLFSFGDGMLII